VEIVFALHIVTIVVGLVEDQAVAMMVPFGLD
jgi:hypothetical protein